MEHVGDLVGATLRHTSRVAERYGALTAQPAPLEQPHPPLLEPPVPHPLDLAEADSD